MASEIERSRDAPRARDAALERLARTLATALRTERRRVPTRPSAGERERRLDEKRRRGETKRLRQRPD